MNSQARWIGERPKWPMSAYSASAPVMTSTMAPIATNVEERVGDHEHQPVGRREPLDDLRVRPRSGSSPAAAIAANHSTVIGPKSAAHPAGPEALRGEEAAQDDRRHGDDDVGQPGCGDLQALDRGQHADRRGDQRVAVEERHADDPQPEEQAGAVGPARVQALCQRGERHDAALAVVVGAHQHADVLHGDDEGDRPEHQGDDTVDIRHGRPDRAVVDREHGLQRVQRAGADVAEHDAQRSQHQALTPGLAQMVARFGGVVRRRRGGRRGGGAAHGLPSVVGRACSGPPRSRSSTTPAAGALPQDCPPGRTINPVGGRTRRTGEEPARGAARRGEAP